MVAAGTIADFGAIILLTLFFSGEGGVGSTLIRQVVLVAGLALLADWRPWRYSASSGDPGSRRTYSRLPGHDGADTRPRRMVLFVDDSSALAEQLGLR